MSPHLFRNLTKKKFHCYGTIRPNRKCHEAVLAVCFVNPQDEGSVFETSADYKTYLSEALFATRLLPVLFLAFHPEDGSSMFTTER
jgi:hypothetical protein